ncbi:AbrB/MazE/SpoVT family DNA-binding domain-containing protein [Bacillus sp. T33-2]|uniref:AbrB/MazE/SpoVT family DNA-binding domain-containing protein n=1 Tax=Bacillus sp. T33-2 TaxID=2054168 RepID=UPI0015E127DD|nr:AbrB/MazE/SpoVT family DNA-binding domain-containing protein [Bacillus sp. T33-2]
MKALGIVRRMDDLGRVVVPIEIRRANGWAPNQPMEMFADDEGGLYIKPYGKDEEKKEVLEQLQHLHQTTDNPAVFQIVSKAIGFIKERG